MEIHVFTGEWLTSLSNRMASAMDGDIFCLPTPMHVHAFSLLKDSQFPQRNLEWTLRPTCTAHDEYQQAVPATWRNSPRLDPT
jgi:hypothetical protein